MKRTKQETIDYFLRLADGFEKDARMAERCYDKEEQIYNSAKADAYRIAAFEVENNMF